jgi:ADP-ribosyl-[dinitrogen reductase] hydrolase
MDDERLLRFDGCLVGLAVGDALGMPAEGLSAAEVRQRFGLLREMVDAWLPAGSTTDDTAMALCIAESLAELGEFDPDDVARRFLAWYRTHPPDMGIHTRHVLSLMDRGMDWREASALVERQNAPFTAGNGSLMRCAPLALRYCHDPQRLIVVSQESSRITHAHPLAQAACAFFNLLLSRLLLGWEREDALAYALEGTGEAPPELRERAASARHKTAGQVATSGYVLDTLECALWAWWHYDDFEEALVAVVNLGGDADTNGAVAGALLGARMGLPAIPQRWRAGVSIASHCQGLARRLHELAQRG